MAKNKHVVGQMHMSGSTRQQRLYDNAIELLKIGEPPEGYYLATSFGKDSIVAHDLVKRAGVKFEAHTSITGIDPPELVYFGREHYPEVARDWYSMHMWGLIQKKGIPPMRHMRYCCKGLKEDKGIGRRCVFGVRAAESNARQGNWAPLATKPKNKADRIRLFDNDDIARQVQQCVPRGQVIISPLYHWEHDDIWDYIKDRNLPYCSLYDEGFDRLGCIGCPMAPEAQRRHEFERWPGFRRLWLHAFQRLIDDGRFSDKGSAEAIFEWWVSDATQEKQIEGQEELWEWM